MTHGARHSREKLNLKKYQEIWKSEQFEIRGSNGGGVEDFSFPDFGVFKSSLHGGQDVTGIPLAFLKCNILCYGLSAFPKTFKNEVDW